MPVTLAPEEIAFVRRAAGFLERPSVLVRVAARLGRPVEALVARLPDRNRKMVQRAVSVSLEKGLDVALSTMPARERPAGGILAVEGAGRGRRFWHQTATGLTGAVGGVMGLTGIAIELPVTTAIMLRSIASTAHDFGEDLEDPASRLECLAVLSLGARTPEDDVADTAYYAVRASLAMLVRQAVEFAAGRTAREIAEAVARGSAPALVRLVATIAARFDVVVTEKLIAQSVPAIGALGGATVNVLFMEHFNTVARYHFGVRALERRYDPAVVRDLYAKEAARWRASGGEKVA